MAENESTSNSAMVSSVERALLGPDGNPIGSFRKGSPQDQGATDGSASAIAVQAKIDRESRRGVMKRIGVFAAVVGGLIAAASGLVNAANGTRTFIAARAVPNPFGTVVCGEPFNHPRASAKEIHSYYRQWIDGKDWPWSAVINVDEGFLQWRNTSDSNAVHYQWVSGMHCRGNADAQGMTNRPVSVDVRVPIGSPATSSAGLLYRWSPQTKFYYAFRVYGDGTYSFSVRGKDGLTDLVTDSSDKIRAGRWNKLGIVGSGARINLYVNGEKINTVTSTELPTGASGLMASGIGTYDYDNFQVYR